MIKVKNTHILPPLHQSNTNKAGEDFHPVRQVKKTNKFGDDANVSDDYLDKTFSSKIVVQEHVKANRITKIEDF